MSDRVLVGDIGGTNARFAIVDVRGPTDLRIVHEARYPSSEARGLAPLVLRYIAEAGTRPEHACFGIACPIVDDDCAPRNLPWKLSTRELAHDIGIPRTRIINDFRAIGYGLHSLSEDELSVLQEGVEVDHGPVALIGAGTGLGNGYLLWDGSRYEVYPSEGGHVDFAPTDAAQRDLLAHLSRELSRVSFERIVSGPGIARIYRFLQSTGYAEEQPAVRAEMAGADAAPVIVRHGLAGTDPLSVRTLEIFTRVYGAAAGNLALTILATGGVYVAGGIAPRIVDRLASGPFMQAFRDKGRLSSIVARIPVRVILTDDVALYGAATVAARTSMDPSKGSTWHPASLPQPSRSTRSA
jgi:glucokinase